MGPKNAELVPLRIGQDHPGHIALPNVDTRGSQPDQSLHLGVLVVGTQVDMDAAPSFRSVNLSTVLDPSHLGSRFMVRDLPPNARGAVYMALGSLVAVVNDGLVRLATEDGLDVYQALFLRGCGMIVIFITAGRARGQRFDRQFLTRPLLLRVTAEVVVAAAAIVVREFATRHVEAKTPPLAIALLTAVAVTAMSGAISIVTGWETITTRSVVVLVLACVCLVVGYLFSIEAVRVGDLSVSAPFRYTSVVGAVAVGLTFFRETPDALTIVGCTLIVVAGVVAARLDALPTKRARSKVALR